MVCPTAQPTAVVTSSVNPPTPNNHWMGVSVESNALIRRQFLKLTVVPIGNHLSRGA
jgi:hypothetical protein